MAVLRRKTKAKKAQLEASAAADEARQAANEAAEAVRDLAQAVAAQVRDLGLDAKAAETVKKVTSSDAYGKAQKKASEAGRKAQVKATDASRKAQVKASEVSRKVAETDSFATAAENASKTSAAALTGLGTWLAAGDRGEKLGIAPAKKRRSGGWFLALLGIGVGYGIGVLTAPRQGSELRDQLADNARQFNGSGGGVTSIDGDRGVLAPSGDPVLADKVRTRLGEDPRTSDAPSLNINVVDGTVVVRGPQDGVDADAVREVVSSVDGVTAVDLELGSTA